MFHVKRRWRDGDEFRLFPEDRTANHQSGEPARPGHVMGGYRQKVQILQ